MDPTCPRCGLALTKVSEPAAHRCDGCGGQAVAVGQLRRVGDGEAVNRLWQAARSSPAASVRCPSCAASMRAVPAFGVELDVCTICQWVWFDAGEHGAVPAGASAPAPAAEDALPPEAVRAFEQLRAGEEGRRRRREWGDGFWLTDLLDAVWFLWP